MLNQCLTAYTITFIYLGSAIFWVNAWSRMEHPLLVSSLSLLLAVAVYIGYTTIQWILVRSPIKRY